ncbi:MAG: UPF0182 family protein [Desulfobacterales bacterium]
MGRWKRWFLAILISAAVIAIFYIALNFIFIDFFVDLYWYGALGYTNLLLLKLLYKYMVFIGVTLIFFLVIFLNFWVASRYLGCTSENACRIEVKSSGRLLQAFRTGSLKVYTPLSLILAIPLAVPLYEQWQSALLYIFGPNSGIKDPVYSIDISYYLFSLPVYSLLQGRLMITLLLLFVFLSVLYYIERRMLAAENQPLYKSAKIHLSVVISLAFLVQFWGYILERHRLLYNTNNEPLFFGPGYLEMNILLPLIWLSAIFFLAMSISLILYVHSRKGLYPLIIFTICFVLSHAGRSWEFLPDTVEKYIVKPNELERQQKYIQNSVHSTLAAYNLTNVEKRDYRIQQNVRSLEDSELRTDLENIPLWDPEMLIDVFQEVQAIRPYYQFSDVDVARYMINGELHQVNLAGREINIEKLPESAQNWINRHLKYTHGYAPVMIPAAQRGEERMEWYIRDMPPESDKGFSIKQPGIYYGTGNYYYAIAPNDSGELHYPGDQQEVLIDYTGSGGIPISSLLKKAIFAVYFSEKNIFFTTKTNSDSRILFRRNIQQRIRTLTPFFELDGDPYLAVTEDELHWIQDAYTMSNWYPYGASYNDDFNYIRNSIKITVDAYNGSVNYYLAEPDDPIGRAYQRMFPGLVKSMDDMPDNLRKQVRYPRDLFEIQMKIYSKYHQVNPETFYKDEDRLQFAKIAKRQSMIEMKPFYLTLDLIKPGKREFILLNPMLPVNRENLRALALVGCDVDNYGRIILYMFPRGQQIYGPSQINALIDQDTTISELVTLWNQLGSEVKRGKMIIFPLGRHILYIEPLYMEATGETKIPELKRIIVSTEEIVVVDITLERAFDRLNTLLQAQEAREKVIPVPEKAIEPKIPLVPESTDAEPNSKPALPDDIIPDHLLN